jgi:hypothetical protein
MEETTKGGEVLPLEETGKGEAGKKPREECREEIRGANRRT